MYGRAAFSHIETLSPSILCHLNDDGSWERLPHAKNIGRSPEPSQCFLWPVSPSPPVFPNSPAGASQQSLMAEWLIPVEQPSPAATAATTASDSNTTFMVQRSVAASETAKRPAPEQHRHEVMAETDEMAVSRHTKRVDGSPIPAVMQHHMDCRETEAQHQEDIFWAQERSVVDGTNISFEQYTKQSRFPLLRIKRIVKSTPEVQVRIFLLSFIYSILYARWRRVFLVSRCTRVHFHTCLKTSHGFRSRQKCAFLF
jgi:hypothetical protein